MVVSDLALFCGESTIVQRGLHIFGLDHLFLSQLGRRRLQAYRIGHSSVQIFESPFNHDCLSEKIKA
jgi:hypothetical protein